MDYFDQEKRRERTLKKSGDKLGSNLSTPEARQKATEFLSDLGTEEAIAMLLQRFTMRITSEIADRDEKEYVLKLVVDFGAKSLGPLRRYLAAEEEIRFALMALAELSSPEESVGTVVELLESIGIPLPRQRSKAMQLLQFLQEHVDPRSAKVVLPLLQEGGNDDLRVAAASVLGRQEESDELRTALMEALVGEEESMRLRTAIVEILVENGWGVQGYRKKVEALLPEGYSLDRGGVVRRRAQGADR